MFSALPQRNSNLSGNTGQNSVGFWIPAKIISVAGICAAESLGEMITTGILSHTDRRPSRVPARIRAGDRQKRVGRNLLTSLAEEPLLP
jgi:hypothetical protein